MKKLIVIAFLLISNTVLGLKYNPDGTLAIDIDWYVNNVNAQTFQISNANELAGFAAIVNGTTGTFSSFPFTGKEVVLTNDIDMESYVDDMGLAHNPVWIPIGTHFSCRFEGIFDGQGHCVKNLIINGDKSGTLFGYNGGVIRNLVIAGGSVCTEYYGAGICSHNSGTVENCINTANIICSNYGGGICGKNYDNGKIVNCINLGYVQQGNMCGGIVGTNSDDGSIIDNCVYDIQMCPLKRGCGNVDNKGAKGLSTSKIVAGQDFNHELYVLEDGLYPRLSVSENNAAMRAALYPVTLAESDNVLGVLSNIKLPSVAGVGVLSPSDPAYLSINKQTGECKLLARAAVVINVNGGGCVKTVNLKIKNATLDFVGTKSTAIKISSYSDLKCFANAVNFNTHYRGFANIDGFADVDFVLADNVHIPTGENWTPVGTPSAPFNGSFSGQGFAISNVYVKRPFEKYCGLFGFNNGTISKLVIVGGVIVGGDYTGGICGYSHGTVEECFSAISVRGNYYTGGIVGFSNEGTIKECIMVNNVVGHPEFSGAICGSAVDGKINYCAFDNQVCSSTSTLGPCERTQILHVSGYGTLDMVGPSLQSKEAFRQFYVENNMYPTPISSGRHLAVKVAATPIFVAPNEDVQNIKSYIALADISDITYHCDQQDVLKITPDKAWPLTQGAVMITVSGGNVDKELMLRIVNKAMKSLGTADNPLLISSYKDLESLRKAVNYGVDYKGFACIDGFKNVYFQLSENIVCPKGQEQLPIGSAMFPFAGFFDGNNKTIQGFSCLTPESDNVGVFGYNSGLIENLHISRANISGRYYTGGICGYNVGRIENCTTDSSKISGVNYAGGISGFSNGVLHNCENSSTIQCDYYAGGISGTSLGRLDTCQNKGIVGGISCLGGIAGSNSSDIIYSFNNGIVKGSDNVGGISGRNSYAQIVNCGNKGRVDGGDCTGGISGINDGTITYCINDSLVVGTITVGGITGKGGRVVACINRGPVKSTGNNAGGIMGGTKGNSEVWKCINYGSISAQAIGGGICSDNKQGAKIVSSANYGPIESTAYVGGICGNNSGQITSCIASCSISGNSYLGAICGRQNNGTLDKCIYDKAKTKLAGTDLGDEAGKTTGVPNNVILSAKGMQNLIDAQDFVLQDGQYPLPLMEMQN